MLMITWFIVLITKPYTLTELSNHPWEMKMLSIVGDNSIGALPRGSHAECLSTWCGWQEGLQQWPSTTKALAIEVIRPRLLQCKKPGWIDVRSIRASAMVQCTCCDKADGTTTQDWHPTIGTPRCREPAKRKMTSTDWSQETRQSLPRMPLEPLLQLQGVSGYFSFFISHCQTIFIFIQAPHGKQQQQQRWHHWADIVITKRVMNHLHTCNVRMCWIWCFI